MTSVARYESDIMGFFGGKKQGGSSSEKLRPSNVGAAVGAREFPVRKRCAIIIHRIAAQKLLLLFHCFVP